MSLWIQLGTAAALGAAASVHCAAMCGPLAAVGCAREGRLDGPRTAGYVGGRLFGYAAMGALAGAVGAPLVTGAAGTAVRLAAAFLVAGVLLGRAAVLLRPAGAPALGLLTLRRGFSGPSRPSRPSCPSRPSRARPPDLFERALPLMPRRGVGLGLATAVFPCGALAGALLAAAASGAPGVGAAMMAAFAVASAPLLLLPALVGHRLGPALRRGWARRAAALALVAAAAWVVTPPLMALARPARPACCAS